MHPRDPGPIYAETDLTAVLVEPWNTFSNLVFLVIVIYWARQTGLRFREYPVLVLALPVLLIGFLGGTLFHATRSHVVWLLLDFIPIIVLAAFASIYFWRVLLGGLLKAGLFFLLCFVLTILLRLSLDLPGDTRISIGYAFLALLILLPAVLCSRRMEWEGLIVLVLAGASFVVAVICRQIDVGFGAELLPMGTHWLWHLFGGFATHLMMKFLFMLEQQAAINRRKGSTLQEEP